MLLTTLGYWGVWPYTGRSVLDFLEYVKRTAPASYRDYARYWSKYHDLIEGLRFESLPCNTWVLKLASKWLSWALWRGVITVDEEARARRLLSLIRSRCREVLEGQRGIGWRRCENMETVVLDKKEWARTLQLAVLYSGARLKHLWLIPQGRRRDYGDVIVYDVNKVFGRKQVFIIPVPAWLEERLTHVIKVYSYESRGEIQGTPVSCLRKIHYELCLAAGNESYCDFIHGRRRVISAK